MEKITGISNPKNLFKNGNLKEENKEINQLKIKEALIKKDHSNHLELFYMNNKEDHKKVKVLNNPFSFTITLLLPILIVYFIIHHSYNNYVFFIISTWLLLRCSLVNGNANCK